MPPILEFKFFSQACLHLKVLLKSIKCYMHSTVQMINVKISYILNLFHSPQLEVAKFGQGLPRGKGGGGGGGVFLVPLFPLKV